MSVAPPRIALRATRVSTLLVLVVLALPLGGCSGDDDSAPPVTSTEATAPRPAPARATLAAGARQVRHDLGGVRQRGLVLGSPTAPVTIVEYGDPTCAPCVVAHRGVVRTLVERFVRTGVASLEYRPLAGSARSRGLARSVFAASEQRRGWDLLQLAALRSVPAPGGAAPREPDARLAAALRLDVPAWTRARVRPRWRAELEAAANVAAVARFEALPVFLVRGRGQGDQAFTIVTQPSSIGELASAIETARP